MAHREQRISTFNGVRLFWELTGSSGEPVVLVHGSWLDHHNWDAVVTPLSRSFRTLTYDRRGHSKSERLATKYSIRDEVGDLASLIEQQRLAPAHIVGTSSGGSIALRVALERPELVRSLVVNEPPLIDLLADDPEGQLMIQSLESRFAAVVEILERGDMESGVRQFVESVAFGPGAWEEIPSNVKETAIMNAPTFLAEMNDPEFLSIDVTGLRGLFCPVLLTKGSHSPLFLQAITNKLQEVLPIAELRIFPESGHEPEQTHPEVYVATVEEFIGRASRSTRNAHPGA